MDKDVEIVGRIRMETGKEFYGTYLGMAELKDKIRIAKKMDSRLSRPINIGGYMIFVRDVAGNVKMFMVAEDPKIETLTPVGVNYWTLITKQPDNISEHTQIVDSIVKLTRERGKSVITQLFRDMLEE